MNQQASAGYRVHQCQGCLLPSHTDAMPARVPWGIFIYIRLYTGITHTHICSYNATDATERAWRCCKCSIHRVLFHGVLCRRVLFLQARLPVLLISKQPAKSSWVSAVRACRCTKLASTTVATREQPPSLRLIRPGMWAATSATALSLRATQPARPRAFKPVSLLKAAMPESST